MTAQAEACGSGIGFEDAARSKQGCVVRIIVLKQDAMVADLVCGREAIYLGTRETCQIQLDDDRVAAQQLVIYPDGSTGDWLVSQLDAAVDVKHNGELLIDRAPARTDDELVFLEYIVRIFPEFEPAAVDRGLVHTTKEQLEKYAATALPPLTITKKADDTLSVQRMIFTKAGRANLLVSQCTTPTEFIDVVMQALFTQFTAQRAWIGLRRVNYGPMEYVEGRFITGESAELPPIGDILQTRALDRSMFLLVPRISNELQVSVLAGPMLGPEGPLGMIYLDSGDSGRRFTIEELDEFIAITSIYGVQLHAIFQSIAKNRAALIEGSVSVTHEIQTFLTPRKLPQWEMLQFGAFREPGREHSGDIYDVVKLVNNLAAFFVAHTSQTGSLAPMLMAQAHAAFRCACMHQDNPAVYLRGLNWLVFDPGAPRTLNCFMGAVDPNSGEMRYGLAGDVGAYIIGSRGIERRLGGETAQPALGSERNIEYAVLSEQIEPGETLVLYTAGVTTARNRKEEVFGEERFLGILGDGFGQLASAMLKEMLSDLRGFTEGGKQPDDITVILAHRVAD